MDKTVVVFVLGICEAEGRDLYWLCSVSAQSGEYFFFLSALHSGAPVWNTIWQDSVTSEYLQCS